MGRSENSQMTGDSEDDAKEPDGGPCGRTRYKDVDERAAGEDTYLLAPKLRW